MFSNFSKAQSCIPSLTSWALQDQVGAVLIEVLRARAGQAVQGAVKDVCLLLTSILEKSLYLAVSVSRSCGLTPHPLRVDDFGKEFRALLTGQWA